MDITQFSATTRRKWGDVAIAPLAWVAVCCLAGCASAPHDNLNSTLWMQTSVEFAGSSAQAYELAKLQLERGLRDTKWTAALEQESGFEALPPAVILDVDETVLDNSPYLAWILENDIEFTAESWERWCNAATAKPLPGVVDFIHFAEERGVTVFFVTNRNWNIEPGTRRNLQAAGIRADGPDRVLMRGEEKPWMKNANVSWGSAKGTRRRYVAYGAPAGAGPDEQPPHRILLLIGDNFGDFTDESAGNVAEREEAFHRHAAMWGTKWIVIPNAMYGSWHDALYGYDRGLAPPERRDRKRAHLKLWEHDE